MKPVSMQGVLGEDIVAEWYQDDSAEHDPVCGVMVPLILDAGSTVHILGMSDEHYVIYSSEHNVSTVIHQTSIRSLL